jgi:hypothetical protein
MLAAKGQIRCYAYLAGVEHMNFDLCHHTSLLVSDLIPSYKRQRIDGTTHFQKVSGLGRKKAAALPQLF